MASVLVIDDEPDMRSMLAFELSMEGFSVKTAESGLAAVEAMKDQSFDAAITDLTMPGMDGVQTIAALKAIDPELEIIVATGYATVETAVRCMKKGAYDYIQKPYNIEELKILLDRAVEHGRERKSSAEPKSPANSLQTVWLNFEVLSDYSQIVDTLWRTVKDVAAELEQAPLASAPAMAKRLLGADPKRTDDLIADLDRLTGDTIESLASITAGNTAVAREMQSSLHSGGHLAPPCTCGPAEDG